MKENIFALNYKISEYTNNQFKIQNEAQEISKSFLTYPANSTEKYADMKKRVKKSWDTPFTNHGIQLLM